MFYFLRAPGYEYVSQHSVVESVSALSAWSRVFLRIKRFVQAEGTVTVAPPSAMTTASKVGFQLWKVLVLDI